MSQCIYDVSQSADSTTDSHNTLVSTHFIVEPLISVNEKNCIHDLECSMPYTFEKSCHINESTSTKLIQVDGMNDSLTDMVDERGKCLSIDDVETSTTDKLTQLEFHENVIQNLECTFDVTIITTVFKRQCHKVVYCM